MKKQLLFIASLFAAFNLSAQTQISNSSFEAWSNDEESDSEQPTFWIPATNCDDTPCLIYSQKTIDSHSGYAAKIIAIKDSESGEISTKELTRLVFPFVERPSKLTFWYKSSTFFVGGINLGVGNSTTQIGQGMEIFFSSSEFTKAEIQIQYNSTDIPDYLGLAFSLGEIELAESDYLIIDDLELVYEPTSISDKEVSELTGSNIVTSSLNLKSNVDELHVYNSSGTLVHSEANTQSANLSNLSEGLYMVTLKKGESYGTMKVLKK